MVFHQHRCIHVHVPKTAGQAIKRCLGEGLFNNVVFPVHEPSAGINGEHLTAIEMRSHDPDGLWEQYFSFAIVRNPWDRMVSEFFWRQRMAPRRVSFPDFEMFLDAVEHGWDFEDTDLRHTLPQKSFVTDSEGRLLVDFLGRHENLHEDPLNVLEKLVLQRQPLPMVNNQYGREHYSCYYTPAARDQVARLFKDDITFFGYEFEAEVLPE